MPNAAGASQLGVPPNQIVGSEDIDFFCGLIGCVADKMGSDHTLNVKPGAFWSASKATGRRTFPLEERTHGPTLVESLTTLADHSAFLNSASSA